MKRGYKKPDELAHLVTIKFRARKADKLKIDNDAAEAGLTVSDYIRGKLVSSKPLIRKATPYREALIRGLAEIGKIGSNVNQLARAANRSQNFEQERVPPELITNVLHGLQTLSMHLIRILTDVD